MAARRSKIHLTADEIVRKQPGWKPTPVPGEAPPEEAPPENERESKIPEFALSKTFSFASKNAADSSR